MYMNLVGNSVSENLFRILYYKELISDMYILSGKSNTFMYLLQNLYIYKLIQNNIYFYIQKIYISTE